MTNVVIFHKCVYKIKIIITKHIQKFTTINDMQMKTLATHFIFIFFLFIIHFHITFVSLRFCYILHNFIQALLAAAVVDCRKC